MTAKRSLLVLAMVVGLAAMSGCAAFSRHQEPLSRSSAQALTGAAPIKETTVERSVPEIASLGPVLAAEYRIGVDDKLEISVYGDRDLSKTQTVRPDGKIDFPLAGTLQAAGLTADDLGARIRERLVKYLRDPQVTVLITEYNSRRVSVLGEVKTPGLLRLSADISLLEAVSRVGGLTENSDLQGALLVRDSKVLPVDFEKLLRRGDLTQNVLLRPNDVVFIPDLRNKKVFILGEVNKPQVAILKPGLTLVESISLAEGFTRSAESRNVLIIRGGLGTPKILEVNVAAVTREGQVASNVPLESGDIVFVPASLIANVVRFFDDLRTIISPFVLAATGITLYPDVKSVLESGKTVGQQRQPVVVGP
jgi:polysaccharide export outer membrane protein